MVICNGPSSTSRFVIIIGSSSIGTFIQHRHHCHWIIIVITITIFASSSSSTLPITFKDFLDIVVRNIFVVESLDLEDGAILFEVLGFNFDLRFVFLPGVFPLLINVFLTSL